MVAQSDHTLSQSSGKSVEGFGAFSKACIIVSSLGQYGGL